MTNIVIAAILCSFASIHAAEPKELRVIDDFENLALWKVQHTDDVVASIASVPGHDGNALRLDFDFNHVNGYATVHRDLPLDFPANYEISFWIRGDAPVNNLQFKLIDASGNNVWWMNRPDFALPHAWQQIRIKKRQIDFAWGPTTDKELKHSAAIEFVVSSGRDGGKGSVYFDDLTFSELPKTPPAFPEPLASASSSFAAPPQNALDEARNAIWCSNSKNGREQTFDIDLRATREFGGLQIDWSHEAATNYDILFSDDTKNWHRVRSVRDGDGGRDPIDLPESETRHIRLAMHGGPSNRYCLNHVAIKDLAWGATPNAFFRSLAQDAPRGTYPRGFTEQAYWTLVGIDGGPAPALISEDGALQPGLSSFSIEPFLIIDGKLVSWADVQPKQSLKDGYLPIPSVEWNSGPLRFTVETFANGTRERSRVFARYRIENTADAIAKADLVLAIRPFQVNPPTQFLNVAGGFSAIHDLAWKGGDVLINGEPRVTALDPPTKFVASTFDSGPLPQRLLSRATADATTVHDDSGYASGALVYHLEIPAHLQRDVNLVAPLTGIGDAIPSDVSGWVDHQQREVAAQWHARLDKVGITLPPKAKYLADTLRTALAHLLLTRDGPSLRPGTRSYARSWIRDGSMIADALLRLGEIAAARDYADWYAPHQFANGKVPCCVDHRGSDPVPENDSHGELIHAIAQLYRYTNDKAALAKHWPHVLSAIKYMDTLRASETGGENAAFKGLMPASISHEGYSAKPMHSYWDDFWALTGYKDAVETAHALGKSEDEKRIAAARDVFRADLYRSIELATKSHAIDYLPGCAELGDFDATSTTIALSPGGEQSLLPPEKLRATFERYWKGFVERRDGTKNWDDYTPYEWRVVGSFLRLGERDRAIAASDFFFDTGARPSAWNQWAEVVGHDPRKQRFVGDMPHGWVASDFIRSTLDRFAYERDDALVLAAGIPSDWFDGNGVAVDHLRTSFGELSYRVQRDNAGVAIVVDAERMPPGGITFDLPQEIRAKTNIHGAAEWKNGKLRIDAAHAKVRLN